MCGWFEVHHGGVAGLRYTMRVWLVHHGGVAGLRYTMGVWLVYSIVLLYILPSPPPLSSVL